MSTLSRRFALAAILAGAVAPVLFADTGDDTKIKVKEGQKAPAVKLEATQVDKVLPDKKDEPTLSLADLKGKNVVLFFYPKAMTKGCTIESCGFRDKTRDFAKLNTVIIGISTDKLEDQQKFTEKEKLTFPLFADPDQKVAKAFGVMRPDKKPMTQRVTFVIDSKGLIRKIYTTVNPEKHPDEVLDYVKDNLQLQDGAKENPK